MFRVNILKSTIISFVSCLFSQVSFADWIIAPPEEIPDDRIVREYGPPGTKVFVQWTKKDGLPTGNPTDIQIIKDPPGYVKFSVPNEAGGNKVTDFSQRAELPNAGEVSVLSVAAFEPLGPDFLVTPFDQFVFQQLGKGVELLIPDLYADTNGDGSIGDGDLLYSAVNLVDFIAGGIIDIKIGDVFTITNGMSPELPGFLFGSAPIVRDATSPNGYLNSSPVSLTAHTGSIHGVSVPEPSTITLILAGVAGLGVCRKVRKGCKHRSCMYSFK